MDKWPPGQSRTNSNLKAFMDRFSLVDIWREKYPNNKSFTWSNKTGSSQSRIDFWLISKNFNKVIDVDVWPTPLTDHKAIYNKIKLSTFKKYTVHSGYWKLNSLSLLNDEVKEEEITRLIFLV